MHHFFFFSAEPPPAANVSYSDVKETKVHIYWDPPELHEVFFIKRYYISYFKHGDTNWFNESMDGDQLTNFQLENLKSDSFYTIKIIAENECCLGQESKKIEIKTLKVKGINLNKIIQFFLQSSTSPDDTNFFTKNVYLIAR